jgi:hypothetical protein
MEIKVRPRTKEISLPPFGLSSPAKREAMDSQIDSWLSLGVISPSKSPWGAPAFLVYRNGKPRMVIDYRKLNEITIPDEFPLPRQEEILQALTGSQWLSTLDALAGFTQITIAKEDREKTAFRTHRGLHHFNRMPFGLRNGPSTFQRIMQGVLAPFLWIFALVYIDDIVVYSRTFEEHLKHLELTFQAMKNANITLAPNKCHFAYRSLLLLGQKVSRLGLSTHKEKVDAILQLEAPKNVKELHTFLGMMVYFSAYIPFYAWIARPLFLLLRKDTKWNWGPLQEEAFELCKQVLTNAPVRAYAIPGMGYRLYTDACDYGLAAILQQVQPIKVKDLKGTKVYEKLDKAYKNKEPVPNLVLNVAGQTQPLCHWAQNFEETVVYLERVISYWSRILKTAECNYSPTEREALALKEGLIKFQPFLEGESVVAITDHAALTWSRTYQNVNRRLLSWGTIMSAYPELKIVHRAGRVHSNVDPISRLRRRVPVQEGPPKDSSAALTLNPTDQSWKHRKPGESLSNSHEHAIKFDDPLKCMYDELGERFEEKLLQVVANYVSYMEEENLDSPVELEDIEVCLPEGSQITCKHLSSRSYTLLIGIEPEEVEKWKESYLRDSHFSQVLKSKEEESDTLNPRHPQYNVSDEGLLYFEDWNGNNRLCVPHNLRNDLMGEMHNVLTEASHGGFFKTYNRIASTYYWPRMSKDIKQYTNTCDICQKSKPRRHAPVGMLQPIPIPSQPFEVVTMDFIPELPESAGYDNILVIVDKLTKYALFIPTTTTLTEIEAAKLFFRHVISKFGIPRQIITDRDTRWKGEFWKEICRLMGVQRSLTTAYHPQADGQSEIMNQGLEIALRAYIGPTRNDWADYLDGLALSYNSNPHTATGFAPAYLLMGYVPTTKSSLMAPNTAIPRPVQEIEGEKSTHDAAEEMASQFEAERNMAKEALLLSQVYQRRAYNQGRLASEFEEGDLVVLNPHSLNLLRHEKGKGQKLLMRYEGPFEIVQKVSPVAYRLKMPASFGIHPVLNIAHLEKYNKSPEELGNRPTKRLSRKDFSELPEFEVEKIIGEKFRKQGARRIKLFRTRFVGYGPESDEWLTSRQLKNAPEVMMRWEHRLDHPSGEKGIKTAGPMTPDD